LRCTTRDRASLGRSKDLTTEERKRKDKSDKRHQSNKTNRCLSGLANDDANVAYLIVSTDALYLITIDFGAVINGYRSDMTRAFVVGEPNKKQLAVYETVKKAQQVGVQSVIAGILGSHPFNEAKKILDASEFAEFQGEGLGHGVGLFLHELPFLKKDCAITLQENMVITIEPGLYIPGWGGLRIEDDIRVTSTGFEMLTHAPRELIQIE
jgi:Xaa-Pro aminopeptidase